jgi:hypothetical protein
MFWFPFLSKISSMKNCNFTCRFVRMWTIVSPFNAVFSRLHIIVISKFCKDFNQPLFLIFFCVYNEQFSQMFISKLDSYELILPWFYEYPENLRNIINSVLLYNFPRIPCAPLTDESCLHTLETTGWRKLHKRTFMACTLKPALFRWWNSGRWHGWGMQYVGEWRVANKILVEPEEISRLT